MRTITILSSLCLSFFIAACGVMWGPWCLFRRWCTRHARDDVWHLPGDGNWNRPDALTVYSDQSGYDEVIFRLEKEPVPMQDPER